MELNVGDKIRNFVDELGTQSRVRKSQYRISQFLFYVGSYISAGIGTVIVDDLVKENTWTDKDFWIKQLREHWMLFIFLGLFLLGAIGVRYLGNKIKDSEPLKYVIQDIYENGGLGNTPEDDIRITVWCPDRYDPNGIPTVMVQWVDYVPKMSNIGNDPVGNHYVTHRKAGREIRVYEIQNGVKVATGLVAQVVMQTINGNRNVILDEDLPDDQSIVQYMMTKYKLPKRRALVLTKDRKCFVAMSIFEPTRRKLLAVVYMDARRKGAITEEVKNMVKNRIPSVAYALRVE